MTEPKAKPPSNSSSDKDERHPHHHHHHHHHQGETHGLRDDIDERTAVSDVKAPNVFERAKEEIEAIVEAIHPKKESKKDHASPSLSEQSGSFKAESKSGNSDAHSEKDAKTPNFIEKAKEEIEALMHKEKSRHHHYKETHGKSNCIDETTPIDEVKAPNVFERAKEEFEALVQAVHPRKESSNSVSSPKRLG